MSQRIPMHERIYDFLFSHPGASILDIRNEMRKHYSAVVMSKMFVKALNMQKELGKIENNGTKWDLTPVARKDYELRIASSLYETL